MAGAAPRKGGMITGINVTPLVDIMLVLLIIFMLTAHVIARQVIEIDLPQASQGTAAPATPLNITIKLDGGFYLNGQATTVEALTAAVKAAVAQDPKVAVIIGADKGVAYGRVVWALDLIQRLEVKSFAIQIDPTATIPPTAPVTAPGSGN